MEGFPLLEIKVDKWNGKEAVQNIPNHHNRLPVGTLLNRSSINQFITAESQGGGSIVHQVAYNQYQSCIYASLFVE